jgi:hypothetical protein
MFQRLLIIIRVLRHLEADLGPAKGSFEPKTARSAPGRFCTRSDALSLSTGPHRSFMTGATDVR